MTEEKQPQVDQTEGGKPKLYGIVKSNRPNNEHWGKNQFNSSFPVSMACYMRDKGLEAVYIELDSNLEVKRTQISFDAVFNTTLPNEEIYFAFESKYEPYQKFAYDDIGNIDVVVKRDDVYLRPLEIKLTVIPDETTHSLSEEEWGAELVIRPATTTAALLGISDSCQNELGEVRKIIEPVCHNITGWGNKYEIIAKMEKILKSLDNFQVKFRNKQKPLLMQPIWRTDGKSAILSEEALDIFVWSDFALCRLFLDGAKESLEADSINRFKRAAARFARCLYEVSTKEKTNLNDIWTEMAFGIQTDKEFAVSGRKARPYMDSPRLVTPSLNKKVLRSIILNGGEKELSPERRLDSTVYYSELFAKSEKK